MSEQKLTQQEASAKIAQLLKEAEAKLDEATKISDETGVSFNWDGPAYGMGAWYEPQGWNDSGCEWETSDEDEYGWKPSSQSC